MPSPQLVPGDIVLLEAGNYVPADIRLLEAANLRIEEAALTGESVPVQKDANIHLEADIPLGDRKNTTFMGTLVSYGRGRGVVVSTGMRTQIGLIAEMLQAVENEPTPLQKRLDQLGKTLGWATLAICGVVFVVSIVRFTDLSLIMQQRWAAGLFEESAQGGDHQHVHAGGGSCNCSRTGRTAGSGDDQPGAGNEPDGATTCAHPQAFVGRDTGFDHGDLFG